jgi:hypothetical protein
MPQIDRICFLHLSGAVLLIMQGLGGPGHYLAGHSAIKWKG